MTTRFSLYSYTLFAVCALAVPGAGWAQDRATSAEPRVMFINMGGNDCPPCRAWRAFEFPKLQKSEVFRTVEYAHVEKAIQSAVPPSFFLPPEVKPYKDVLDKAGSRMSGSPQQVILVDGQVWDYHWGARTAEEIEGMLLAAKSGTVAPIQRCVIRRDRHYCLKPVS